MIYYCFFWKKFLKQSTLIIFIFLFLLFLLFSLRSIPLFLYKIDIFTFFPFFCILNFTKFFVLMVPLGFIIGLLFFIFFLKETKGFLSLSILGIGQKFWIFFWFLPYVISIVLLLCITLRMGPYLYQKTDDSLKKIPPFLENVTKNKSDFPSFLFPGFFFNFSKNNQHFIFYRCPLTLEKKFFFFGKNEILCCKKIKFLKKKNNFFCILNKGNLAYLQNNSKNNLSINSRLIFQDYSFLLKNMSLDLSHLLSSSLRKIQGESLNNLLHKTYCIFIKKNSQTNNIENYKELSYRLFFPFLLILLFIVSFILTSLGLIYSIKTLFFFWLLFFFSFIGCFLNILLSTWGLFLELFFIFSLVIFFFIIKKFYKF